MNHGDVLRKLNPEINPLNPRYLLVAQSQDDLAAQSHVWEQSLQELQVSAHHPAGSC